MSDYPTQQRRASQLQEAGVQERLADLLPFLLPAGSYWTMAENKPRSATAGAMQKRRGVRAGQPDLFVIYRGKPIFVELKSLVGVVSRTQKVMREEIIAAGGDWWLARSERAAVVALHLSGVQLRSRSGKRFRPPALPPWEQPVQDLALFKPSHPRAIAERSAARRRQRERAKARQREAEGGVVAAHTVADELAEARLKREQRAQEQAAQERQRALRRPEQERLEQERLNPQIAEQ
jgi:hypothetical protein